MSTAQSERQVQELAEFRKAGQTVEAAGLTFQPLVTYPCGAFVHPSMCRVALDS